MSESSERFSSALLTHPEAARNAHRSRASSLHRASKEQTLEAGLYLVSTPIGNLEDITLRSLRVLHRADKILCEDTRIARKLLSAYGIAGGARLTKYNEQSDARTRRRILEILGKDKAVALVSDAGTPLVSDPGFKLVRAVIGEGLAVIPIPGASALLPALQVSGLPFERFFFAGFAPRTSAARRRFVLQLRAVPGALVVFESPRRLGSLLIDLAQILGSRTAAVACELTKRFFKVFRGVLPDLASDIGKQTTWKGEVVIVIEALRDRLRCSADELDLLLRRTLPEEGLKSASHAVSVASGWPRREVYVRALALRKQVVE